MEILRNTLSLIVLASAIGTWYFIKKHPNTKYRNISIAVLVISFIVVGITSQSNSTNTENAETTTSQVVTSSSTSSVASANEKTEASTSDKTEESSSSEATSSSQEIKNDGPDYTEESNTQFANHLTTEINNQIAESGYQVRVQPLGRNVVYLYVPQEVKYYSKVEIQQIADNFYKIKESTFTNWAIDNGYDLGFTNSPKLYVKAEDDTTLAEESGIINKSMKVKVNN